MRIARLARLFLFLLTVFLAWPHAVMAASPTLVVNEIMFNPSGADAGGEWVELIAVNDVNVNGYAITDNDGNSYTFPSVNVGRGETIVVHFAAGLNDTTGPTYHFYTGVDAAWLSNTGDDIEIQDSPGGTPQDYIAYGSGGEVDAAPGGNAGWGAGNIDITVVDEGHSIGLNEDADDLDDNSNWEEVIVPNPGDPNQSTTITVEKSGADQIHLGDTAGEEYVIAIENTGAGAVFVEEVLDDYPANFNVASVNAVTLNGGAYGVYSTGDAGGVYSLGNMPHLLPGDQVEIRLQMTADCTATKGFNNNVGQIDYRAGEGAAVQSVDHTFATEVIFGILDPIMVATHKNGVALVPPTANPEARVGDRVTYKVELHNVFDGDLYDVTPEALWGAELSYAGSLSTSGLTCSAGATITCNPVSILGETEDDTYSFSFDLDVNGCLDIDTTIQATDRCNPADSVSSSVYLDLGNPDIDYTISAMDIPYGGTTPVTIDVFNSGNGPAWDFELDTGFEGECVDITNVAAVWTYNAGTGVFSYTAGEIDETRDISNPVQLTFDLGTCGDCSNRTPGGAVRFEPYYDNDCDEEFISPKKLASYSTVDAPTVGISKTMSTASGTSFAVIGDQIDYTVTLSVSDKAGISGDIEVTDAIPAGSQTYVGGSLSAAEGVAAIAGNTITWTVGTDAADNPDGATLTFSTTIPMDACLQGTTTENTASFTATDSEGCLLNASDGAGTIYINNNPNNSVVAQKNVSGDPNVCDAAGATFTNDYVIASGVVGEWDTGGGTPSTITDDLDGGQLCYLAGTAEYNFDEDDSDAAESFTGWTPVPGAYITYSYPLGNPLQIDLAFLSAIDQAIGGDDNVAGNNLQIRYDVYACEGLSGSYDAITAFRIDGNAGSCGGTGEYEQHGLVSVIPVDVGMGIQLLDAAGVATEEVESCGEYKVRIDVTNPSGDYTDLIVEFPPTNYEYIGNPVYTGFDLNTPDVSGTDPIEFSFDATPAVADLLTEGGTITFDVRKYCDQTPSSVSATGTYYTPEDDPASCCVGGTCGGTRRNLSASDAPIFEYRGDLELKATPDPYPIDTKDLQWSLYVYNRGDGHTYNTFVTDVFGPGLSYLSSTINGVAAAPTVTPDSPNPGETTIEWDLGDMAPNETVEIEITAEMSGVTCDPLDTTSDVSASWGCAGTICEALPATAIPTFSFLESEASAYNVFPTAINLCGDAEVVFRIKNINKADVYGVEMIQDLETTGMTYIPGSAKISTNPAAQGDPGHSSWAAIPNPIITGGTRLAWQGYDNALSNYLPELEVLESAKNVLIYFQAETDCDLPTDPQMHVEASYQKFCDVGSAPARRDVIVEDQQTIPFYAPELTVEKLARNVTAGGTFGSTNIYAGQGDTVEYQITVANTSSQAPAENVTLTDALPANLTYVSISEGGGSWEEAGPPTYTAPDVWNLETVDVNDTDVYIIQATVNNCVPEVTNTAELDVGCDASSCTFPDALGYGDVGIHGDLITQIDFDSSASIGATGFNTCGGEITITVQNNGAPTGDVLIEPAIPAGWNVDDSIARTVVYNPAPDNGYVENLTDLKNPVWTLNQLDNGQSASVTFFLAPDGSYCDNDLNSDPAPPPSSLSIPIGFTANDSCGNPSIFNDSLSVSPEYIDLDVDITPDNQLIVEGNNATFNITVTNNGNLDAPDNTANFTLNLGNGFTITDGDGGVVDNAGDPRTVTWANLGVISSGGGTWTATVQAQVGVGNLEVQGVVEGECDSSVFCRYSYDEDTPDVAGIDHSKEIVRIDEPGQVLNPSRGEATIGNAVYYDIHLRFPGEGTYTDVTIFDNTNNRFLILDSESQFLVGVVWEPVNSGNVSNGIQIDSVVNGRDRTFTVHDGGGAGFTIPPGGGPVDIILRVVALVSGNAVASNNPYNQSQVNFTYDSGDGNVTYNNTNYTSILRDTVRTRIYEPNLTPNKSYPGWPGTYNDANPMPVVVGDQIDFTLSFTNSSANYTSPAYDVVVTDAIPFGMRSENPDNLDVFIDTDGDFTTVERALLVNIDYTVTDPDAGNGWTLTIALNNSFNGDTANTNIINAGESLVVKYRGEVDSNSGAGLLIQNQANADYSSIRGTPVAPESDERTYTTDDVYTILSTGDTTITKASTLDGATVEEADQIIYTLTFPNPVQGVYLYGDDDDSIPEGAPEFYDTIPDGLEVQNVGISITATRACENIYGVIVPPYGGEALNACSGTLLSDDDRVYTVSTSPVGAVARDRAIEIQFNKMYPGDYLVITITAKVHYDFDDGSLIPDQHVFENQGHIEVYTKPSSEADRTFNVYDSETVTSIYHKLISITPDRSSQTTPGNWVTYEHTVRNQTSSTEIVCFSTASSLGWDWVVYDDLGNILTDGATKNSLPVIGNDTEKITLRYFVPSDTPDGTTDGTLVLMHPYDPVTGTCEDAQLLDNVTDTTVVLITQLELTKWVRECGQLIFTPCGPPPWVENNEALPCWYLEYKIEFFNSSTRTFYSLYLNDSVPNYTDFVPDGYGVPGSNQDVLLHRPDGGEEYINVVGTPTELQLDLSAQIPQLEPGDKGWIQYKVRVKGDCGP